MDPVNTAAEGSHHTSTALGSPTSDLRTSSDYRAPVLPIVEHQNRIFRGYQAPLMMVPDRSNNYGWSALVVGFVVVCTYLVWLVGSMVYHLVSETWT